MSDVNVPMLRKVVEWAEAEAAKPKESCAWYQGLWYQPVPTDDDDDDVEVFYDGTVGEYYAKTPECGTCFCIAGYAASITLKPGETMRDERILLNGVFQDWVYDRAVDVLGIPEHWSSNRHVELFRGTNTIHDVRRIAEELAGEKL